MKFKVKIRITSPQGKKFKYSLNLEEGVRFALGKESVGLGLDHPSVSPSHCLLYVENGTLIIGDNNSQTGVTLNNQKTLSGPVREGDLLQLGDFSVEFLEVPHPQEDAPPETRFIDLDEAKQLLKGGAPAPQPDSPDESLTGNHTRTQTQTQTKSHTQTRTRTQTETRTQATQLNPHKEPEKPTSAQTREVDSASQRRDPLDLENAKAPARNSVFDPGDESAASSYSDTYSQAAAEPMEVESKSDVVEAPEPKKRRPPAPRPDHTAFPRRFPFTEEQAKATAESKLKLREKTGMLIRKQYDFLRSNTDSMNELSTALRRRNIDAEVALPSAMLFLSSGAFGAMLAGDISMAILTVFVGSAAAGLMIGAGLAWILSQLTAFMEAESDFRSYLRFVGLWSVALIPIGAVSLLAPAWTLNISLLVWTLAMLNRFIANFRPVPERFLCIFGGYFAVLGFVIHSAGFKIPLPSFSSINVGGKPMAVAPAFNPDADTQIVGLPEQNPPAPAPPIAQQQPQPPVQQAQQAPLQQQPPMKPQMPIQAQLQQPQLQQQAQLQPQAQLQQQQQQQPQAAAPTDPFLVEQFQIAAKSGDFRVLRSLITEKGVNPNLTNETGATALMLAAYQGQMEAVKYLLSARANINAQDNQGTTALMWAVFKGNAKMAAYLVTQGADQAIRRKDGDTALEIAKRWGYAEVAQVLENPMAARNLAGQMQAPAPQQQQVAPQARQPLPAPKYIRPAPVSRGRSPQSYSRKKYRRQATSSRKKQGARKTRRQQSRDNEDDDEE